MREQHRYGIGIATSGPYAPAGKCELCGARTPLCLTGDRVYRRFCPGHAAIAAKWRQRGRAVDGSWRPTQVTNAGHRRR